MSRYRFLLRSGLLVSCLVPLLVGCRHRGGFTPPALPTLAAVAPPAPKATPARPPGPPLTFARMKQLVKVGMTDTQLRAALGKPFEDFGAARLDDQAKYGRSLEELSYIAPDGDMLVYVVNGRVLEWYGGPSKTPQNVPTASLPSQYLPPVERKKIYLVPIGDFSASQTQALIQYAQQKQKLSVQVLPPAPLYAALLDRERERPQLVAEKLIGLIKRQNPDLAEDPFAILIGLTQYDICMRKEDLTFVFGTREGSRFAVISTARMDPVNFGKPANPSLLQTRLQKMLLRDIGMLYYERSGSNDPQSVLYKSIGGLEDLDTLGEKL
jgi:predicted Zn-dependent protease